jgi:benzoyl-CoA reductase/2-hydroxyglutaryl-CoA dehydratase subunit BcrC/BadD/HgdB
MLAMMQLAGANGVSVSLTQMLAVMQASANRKLQHNTCPTVKSIAGAAAHSNALAIDMVAAVVDSVRCSWS